MTAGMTTEVVPATTYIQAATSPNTRKAYQQDLTHFLAWGGQLPATPSQVMQYLQAYAASLQPRTLTRRLTALSHWHTYQGFTDPTVYADVRKTLIGIHHVHGQPPNKAPALTLEHLTCMSRHLQQCGTLAAMRTNAMLQLQFFGALRVSELLAMQYDWLGFTAEGLTINIPRSKTDQSGQGQVVAIPITHAKLTSAQVTLAPVQALQTWLQRAGITTGYIFPAIHKSCKLGNTAISTTGFNKILQQLSQILALPHRYSSHSLRSGFATAASRQRVTLAAIMQQGRWRNVQTVMGYIAAGQRFVDNAAGVLLTELTTTE